MTTNASDLGRQLAAHRQHATYECVVCGKAFEALRQTGERTPLTCSQSCRSKRWRQERKARNPTQ